jgi:hypothetical protein
MDDGASSGGGGGECVRVVVRVRPLSEGERASGRVVAVTANAARREIRLEPGGGGADALSGGAAGGAAAQPSSLSGSGGGGGDVRTFTFDAVYGPEAAQADVYASAAAPIVEGVLAGFNGTVFAYGQTGSGKSHTMEGGSEAGAVGLIPLSFAHIFGAIARRATGAAGAGAPAPQFLVRASYLEIYQEDVRDLLSREPDAKLELKEHPDTGVYVRDLTAVVVKSVAEIDAVLQAGKRRRVTGRTAMNERSSRSHTVFQLRIKSRRGAELLQGVRVCVHARLLPLSAHVAHVSLHRH